MFYTVFFYKPEPSIQDINVSHKLARKLVLAYREEDEPAYFIPHPELFENDEEAIRYISSAIRAI